MAAKRNKFHLSAVRAAIHGSTEGWIATIDHLVHVFDYGSTWMEDINHFFVMVCKDFLKDIHMNIIEEMDGKKKPHPSRLRGRGVEVSKTLCSQSHSQEEFDRWWTGEGRERRYFSCKGRVEKLQNLLAYARVEEQDHPKMRPGGSGS